MRKILVVGVLLLVGCQGIVGPFQRAQMKDPVNDPSLSLSEQEKKSRDRLAYPDDVPAAEPPRTALDLPEVNRYGR